MHAYLTQVPIAEIHPENPRIVRGTDGIVYMTKGPEDGAEREAYYHWLAGMMHAPVPPTALLYDNSGRPRFGSQWEADMLELTPKAKVMRLLNSTLASALSRICALDYMAANDDRHAGNILLRVTPMGLSVRAYDFAGAQLAQIARNPLRAPLESSNTGNFWRIIFSSIPFDAAAALDAMGRARALPLSRVHETLAHVRTLWPEAPGFLGMPLEVGIERLNTMRTKRFCHLQALVLQRYDGLYERAARQFPVVESP